MLVGTGGICYLAYWFYRLKQKIKSADNNEEVQFTEKEALFIGTSIRFLSVTTRFFRRVKRRVRKFIPNCPLRKGASDEG